MALDPVPPIGGAPLALFFTQVGVLLLMATLLGRLAVRLKLPAIVGELLTGVILGPSLIGHSLPQVASRLFPHSAEQAHLLDAFGQIGVVLLVAITGLQLDTRLVRKRAATAARVSLPGFLIPLALGIGVGSLVPASLLAESSDRTVFAMFLGIAMSVSAIPVIAKTLMDLGLLHRNVGQLILVSGTVDDVLAWLGLSVVTAMATTGVHAAGLAETVGYLLLFVVGSLFVGRPLVRKVMRTTAKSAEPGVTLGVTVVIVILFSVTTHALGFEAIFGALVAGVLIRSGGKDVLTRLAPLRTFVMAVLAPVFFATAGLRMDLTALADPMVLATALLLLLIAVVGKFAGAFIGAWSSGLSRWEAVALGAGMNARGVVEVIVAMVGLRLGVLSTAMYTVIVLIAVATSLMGPPILRMAMSRLEVTAEEQLRRAELDDTLDRDGRAPVPHG
ncbi:cation:proton antiporter [Streptomyces antarcticus]|uniref:cation:proton antiporter n=1 Tax=Streptomyces antarcticus TaxID=2996458 RepID=UPI00226F4CF3|nr:MULTISPECIES: cation:proton antiporter [unclassified Streptomyces]MCY0941371.1 cation:proton antiporter [Streptomyces sp. H34-AA3]MCZ4086069.1 cation:proton antiporter [Streptomyces sp. H34-S5]